MKSGWNIGNFSIYNTCILLFNNEKYVDANLDVPYNVFRVMHPHQRCFKLLVSGLLTGHICYVYLFLHHNRLYIYISIVPCKSFVILTSYWQRRVSCMRQDMFTLSETHSTAYHSDINILSILHNLGSPLS